MQYTVNPKLRLTLYIIVVIGTSVIVPLYQYHIVHDVAMSVWTSVSGAIALLAAFNVKK